MLQSQYTHQLYQKNNFTVFEKVSLGIALFSLFNQGVLNYILPIYLLIPLIDLKQKHTISNYKNIFAVEVLYFIFLFIVIKFFIEYTDSKEDLRTFMQSFDGKYLSQFTRFCLELFFGSYLYEKFKKNKYLFIKIFIFILNSTLIVAVSDYFLLNKFLANNLVGNELVSNRFTGLNLEPRHFGLILVYTFIFLRYMNFSNNYLLFLIFCIFFTFSVSTIILFLFSMFLFSYDKTKILTFFMFIILSISLIIVVLMIFSDELVMILDRLTFLVTLKNDNDYFKIFSVFEVFDRSALNALTYNLVYLFTGYGPNTITIIATDYISNLDYRTYDGIINTSPHMGLVNILSRSGIFMLISIIFIRRKNIRNIHFYIYLLQSSFLFYSFFLIIDDEKKK